MTISEETALRLEHIVAKLHRDFPAFPHQDVNEVVDRATERLIQDAHFEQFVPLLVQRAARDELARRTRVAGGLGAGPLELAESA